MAVKRKQLHKHAMPLVMVLAALFVGAVLAAGSYSQISGALARGLVRSGSKTQSLPNQADKVGEYAQKQLSQ